MEARQPGKMACETKECVVSVEKAVCVSCGDRRCPVRDRQVKVARVTVVQKVSYAEAVKRVVEEDGYRVRDTERIPVSRQKPRESDGKNMCFSKVGFSAFIAMVVNCTAEMDQKSQKIVVVVAAANKYLRLRGFTA